MREGVRVRAITNEEGNRLLRIVRRSSGSVVTWRRAQMVLLSAQGMDVAQIVKVAFTSPDRVRAVLQTSTRTASTRRSALRRREASDLHLPQRRQIKKIALSRPADHGLPFDAVEPVQAGRVPRCRGGGRRHQPRGSPCAPPRGGRELSSDQDLQAEQRPRLRSQEEPGARVLRHRRWQGQSEKGDPSVMICMNSPPLDLLPRPGRQWAPLVPLREAQAATAAPASGHFHPHCRCASSHGGLRLEPRQDLWPRQDEKGPHHLLGVLPLPAQPLPGRAPHRHRARTSARTCPRRRTPSSATRPMPTTSSWPTFQPMPAG